VTHPDSGVEPAAGAGPTALLLDVGYVIIEISWPAVEAYAAVAGTRLNGAGSDDPRWLEHVAGRMSPDEYWDEAARSLGLDGMLPLFRVLVDTVPDELFDPAAVALMQDVRAAAGRRLGILSNDAYSFIGRGFFDQRPEFAGLDAFVDATEVGFRKPAAEAYLAAADALATPPEGIVFLDDTPECVEGALRVGMLGILVDPFDRTTAFAQARDLLGLAPGAGRSPGPGGGAGGAGPAHPRR
jgi:HAD superfamily hydrolase (TIGR01509 family)